jgi:hypothetical protein
MSKRFPDNPFTCTACGATVERSEKEYMLPNVIVVTLRPCGCKTQTMTGLRDAAPGET